MTTTMKIARISADMTQKQVADKMGIHTQTYAKFENNPEIMSIQDAKLFASIVGKKVSDIFFINDSN
jgi:DNA-binding XRE family transcriptional regulator